MYEQNVREPFAERSRTVREHSGVYNDDSGGATPIGWHVGRVRFFGVSHAHKKACPTANFVLRYTKKETNAEIKEGLEEPRELSAKNYGRDELWVLLDSLENPS